MGPRQKDGLCVAGSPVSPLLSIRVFRGNRVVYAVSLDEGELAGTWKLTECHEVQGCNHQGPAVGREPLFITPDAPHPTLVVSKQGLEGDTPAYQGTIVASWNAVFLPLSKGFFGAGAGQPTGMVDNRLRGFAEVGEVEQKGADDPHSQCI
ncbi:hypothetical protein BJ085DRAFT_31530 [Dimargaris cristalligena]|uniref:Uncharacterized protein n=1 Tax=Dimargaris cristalligena TaxID=215637 RepID=A0A4P9ZYL0_9FUNG|nr:hypothetical protein BJ085DRAFT_31530 [Dimargaris cristalligena]|eukprot:RKP37840.1 hypothetical protein BJ085DRAFT_31530 [Dimargaris cristalligena]